MLRIYLGLFFLFMSVSTQAQPQLSEYYPIGTTWEEVLKGTNQDLSEEVNDSVVFVRYNFTVDRDTIIEERAYKAVNFDIIENLRIPEGLYLRTDFFIREEGDYIYFNYDGTKGCDELIYNFNWQEDMSELLSNRDKYDIQTVTFAQEVLLDGNTYDCYIHPQGYEVQIDCNGLRPGIYILYINVNGKVYSEKVTL